MWCPVDHYSWNDAVRQFQKEAEKVLSLVALGGKPIAEVNGEPKLIHTAEFYLEREGFAEDHGEASLIVAITACFLLCKFLEDYPPVIVGLDGKQVSVDPILFEHLDQLAWCPYFWPLKSGSEFSQYFQYHKSKAFKPWTIFDRFVFIAGNTGEICIKNGVFSNLVNRVGIEDDHAYQVIKSAERLAGHVVCWTGEPDNQTLRYLFQSLEIDEVFKMALDHCYGELVEQDAAPESRRAGRPSKQAFAANTYWSRFPEGHESVGKSWKEALAVVNLDQRSKISEDTLKRAVAQTRVQKMQ